MKITNTLPQFTDTNALLIVSGTQHAEAYRAYNGEIERLVDFRASLPEHSDRPDIKVRSVGGQTLGTWSTQDDAQKELERAFIDDFKEQTKMLAGESWDAVYLFAPPHALKHLAETLPKTLGDKLAGTVSGNYTKVEPFELLKKISTTQ